MLTLLNLNVAGYIDPSVMTYAIQAIAGVIIAVGAFLGIYLRKAKKKLKELEKELEVEFEEPLKKLTKLQGKIMIKMIEKELNTPMYEVLKGIKGMGGIKPLVILPVAAFHFPVMTGCERTDQFMTDSMLL